MLIATVLALAAAFGFAACTVMQHAESQQVETRGTGLLVRLLGRPRFLASLVVEGIALLLQAFATGFGTVALVQPLLVCGLLFAVLISAGLERRRVSVAEAGGAVLCCVGLALFLFSSHPSAGVATLLPGRRTVALTSALLVAAVAAALARLRPAARGASLALSAGVLLGLGAMLLKVTMHQLQEHGAGGLVTWQFPALVASGLAGTVAAQSAFQSGSLPSTVAILTLAEPLTAIILGALLLGEHLSTSAADLTTDTVAVALAVAGVIVLSSHARETRGPAFAADGYTDGSRESESAVGPGCLEVGVAVVGGGEESKEVAEESGDEAAG